MCSINLQSINIWIFWDMYYFHFLLTSIVAYNDVFFYIYLLLSFVIINIPILIDVKSIWSCISCNLLIRIIAFVVFIFSCPSTKYIRRCKYVYLIDRFFEYTKEWVNATYDEISSAFWIHILFFSFYIKFYCYIIIKIKFILYNR